MNDPPKPDSEASLKTFLGREVRHAKYGVGVVTECCDGAKGYVLRVRFSDASREFAYPEAFRMGFLTAVRGGGNASEPSAADPRGGRSEKLPTEAENRRGTRFFLVDHGAFYGKEILHGILFVPKSDPVLSTAVREIRAGDVFFQISPMGLSAVGKAIRPCRATPYPAWRYAEASVGAKGYAVDLQSVLLAAPLAPSKPLSGYLTRVDPNVAERLIGRIAESTPSVSDFLRSGAGETRRITQEFHKEIP